MEISQLTMIELRDKLVSKKISVKEALDSVFKEINNNDGVYNAYVTVDKENAYKQGELAQKRIDENDKAPLLGVPVAIKDNICTKGLKTTCSSHILDNFIPTYDATVVKKLKDAGAIIIGKTNMDEFAMGSTTETSYFGETKNPRNIEHVPGGSSGGSAAAVAANECFAALGSDTGGSIRQPASYCGVVGIKPTYSSVSRYGLIAYGSSLDQIGPVTKDVRDAANLLHVISGFDEKDATSSKDIDRNYTEGLVENVKDLTIGIPEEYFTKGLNSEVKEAVLEASRVLENMGAKVETFKLNLVDYAIPAYYTIASAEASSNLERFDGIKYGYRSRG